MGRSTFVAVGAGGVIKTSSDGEQWATPASGTLMDLLGLAYVADRFLALGKQGTLPISQDGSGWVPFSPAQYQGGYDKTNGVVVTHTFTAREST